MTQLFTRTRGVQGNAECIAGTQLRTHHIRDLMRKGWTDDQLAFTFRLTAEHLRVLRRREQELQAMVGALASLRSVG
jgi:uncharacterized protein (DUF433 family)